MNTQPVEPRKVGRPRQFTPEEYKEHKRQYNREYMRPYMKKRYHEQKAARQQIAA